VLGFVAMVRSTSRSGRERRRLSQRVVGTSLLMLPSMFLVGW
jgi:hypothetical protein